MSDLRSSERDLFLVRGQVLPRLRRLVLDWVPALALGVSVGLALLLPRLPGAVLPIREAAGVGVTFASIAMGACIAATVLAVGLPSPERLRRWANLRGSTPGKSALSDLVFVLVWASLAQTALIATSVLAMAFGNDLPLAPTGMSIFHAFGLWLGLFVFFYALFELVVVVQTLSQMAVMVIAEEQQLPSGDSAATDE